MRIRAYNSLCEYLGEGEGATSVRILFKEPILCQANDSFEITFIID